MRLLPTLSILVASLASASVSAQSPHPIVGAWERFSIKDSTGTDISPAPAAAFTIFSAEGFYSQTAIPASADAMFPSASKRAVAPRPSCRSMATSRST